MTLLKNDDLTVIVVEDDHAVCKSLSWLLNSVDLKTQIYTNPTDYLRAYNPNQYSCLLIDIRLPVMSGFNLLELLKKRYNPIPVIFITGHGDIESVIHAMKLGAKDFILKPFNDEVLLQKIQTIALESYEYQEMYQQFFHKIQTLTTREQQVMDFLAQGKLNDIIADKLNISLSTVEIYRSHIMRKLGIKSVAELVKIHLKFCKDISCFS